MSSSVCAALPSHSVSIARERHGLESFLYLYSWVRLPLPVLFQSDGPRGTGNSRLKESVTHMSLSIRHALVGLVVQIEGMLAVRERPT